MVDGQVVSPGCLVKKGSRPVVWILESSLGSDVSLRREKDYERLLEKWIRGMELGIYTKKKAPVSQDYVQNKLRWGLSKYWTLLGEAPSIAGLNAENFELVMAHPDLKADMEAQKDRYASKKAIYSACTGFMAFLIREGLKNEKDLAELRKKLPGKLFKLKRRALDPDYVRYVMAFNRAWRNGRTKHDIEILDMLIHLYFYAGLRRTGAAGLKISNIDFKNHEMIVLEKGCKERIVPLDLFSELQPKMEAWLKYHRPPSDTDFFLVKEDGSPLTRGCIKDKFKRLGMALRVDEAFRKLALVEPIRAGESARERERRLKKLAKEKAKTIENKFTPHPLRHTFATMVANLGMPAPMLQQILGHEDLETTQGYIGVTQRDIKNWINRRNQSSQAAPPTDEPKPADMSYDGLFDLLLNEE